MTAAYQYYTTGDASYHLEMCQKLGLVFHAAQDFYAHSNWIENNPDGVTADLEGTMPSYWMSGTWPHDYPQSSIAGAPTHGDLNKDFPLRRGYDEAYNDAVAETKKQFALFQSALRNSYPSDADAIFGKVFAPWLRIPVNPVYFKGGNHAATVIQAISADGPGVVSGPF